MAGEETLEGAVGRIANDSSLWGVLGPWDLAPLIRADSGRAFEVTSDILVLL